MQNLSHSASFQSRDKNAPSKPGIKYFVQTRAGQGEQRAYLTEQIALLIENDRVSVEIGESDEPMPVHFAYRRDINIEANVATHS